MRKLIVILFLALSVLVYGQRNSPLNDYYIEFDMSTITGTDTVLYYYTPTGRNPVPLDAFGGRVGVEIEYKSLDANDATFDFGGSISGHGFLTLGSDYDLPYTLNTADSAQANGSIRPSISEYKAVKWFNIPPHPFKWLPIKITKGSVTSGILYIWIYQLRE